MVVSDCSDVTFYNWSLMYILNMIFEWENCYEVFPILFLRTRFWNFVQSERWILILCVTKEILLCSITVIPLTSSNWEMPFELLLAGVSICLWAIEFGAQNKLYFFPLGPDQRHRYPFFLASLAELKNERHTMLFLENLLQQVFTYGQVIVPRHSCTF